MFLFAVDNGGRNPTKRKKFYEMERREENNKKGEIFLSTLRSKFFHKLQGVDLENFFIDIPQNFEHYT